MRDQLNVSGDPGGAKILVDQPATRVEAAPADTPKVRKLRLSPFYLNTRRLSVLGQVAIPSVAQRSIARNSAERASAMAFACKVADRLLAWGRFPSLTRELLEAGDGDSVTAQIWDVLSFSGAAAAIDADRSGVSQPARMEGSITLEGQSYAVAGDLLTDHFYSGSTSTNLRGRKRLLVAGSFQLVDGTIEVSPHVIGDLIDVTDQEDGDFGWAFPWKDRVRAYPEQIEAFAKIRGIPRGTAKEVRELGKIPEEDVKHAFAQILGEPFVPKDWGGEKSDLQTNHLVLDGEPCAAAFAFKGPGIPGELHPNKLGKRGDQLIRAFDEPVELVVLQHHNKIANTVVREAESLASNPKHPRRYCILDGADTVRILRGHGMFPPPAAPPRS